MINYVEKGIGLHRAISTAGHSLYEHDGVWVADDETAVQAIIDSYIDRDTKLVALTREYTSRIIAGRKYLLHTYQIDEVSPNPQRPSSIATINAIAAMADRAIRVGAAGTPWDAGQPPFLFYDASNQGVAMTAQEAYDFATNIGTYVNALKQNLLKLKTQLMAAATQADVDAIDVTSGWPTN